MLCHHLYNISSPSPSSEPQSFFHLSCIRLMSKLILRCYTRWCHLFPYRLLLTLSKTESPAVSPEMIPIKFLLSFLNLPDFGGLLFHLTEKQPYKNGSCKKYLKKTPSLITSFQVLICFQGLIDYFCIFCRVRGLPVSGMAGCPELF